MAADAQELMVALTAKLYSIIMGRPEDGVNKDQVITWCAPGIPIHEEDLDFAFKGIVGKDADETAKLLLQASDFAHLVDFIPDTSGFYARKTQEAVFQQTGTRLSEMYQQILNMSEVANSELTDVQKAKLAKFRELLTVTHKRVDVVTDEEVLVTEDGPLVKAYKKYWSDYLVAALEYRSKQANALSRANNADLIDFSNNGPLYRQKVSIAEDAWTGQGYRYDYEKIQAYIDQVTRANLLLWKQNLIRTFDDARKIDADGTPFYLTSFVPGNFARADAGWTTFKFAHSEYDYFSSQTKSSWSVGGGFKAGLFGASGGASGSSANVSSGTNFTNFSMSFSLAQIPISRPWLSMELLKSRGWRYRPDTPLQELSDGQSPPSGLLPAVPTSAIFIRDVTLNFDEMHSAYNAWSDSIQGGGSVSYGLFSLGGSYSRSKSDAKFKMSIDNRGLTIEGLQLIGFSCHTLPKCPDPLPTIKDWA